MKKFLNVVGVFLSVIVIIALFGLELLLGIKAPLTRTMSAENLSVIMEDIDIEKIFRDEKGKEKPMGTRIYKYFDEIGLSREGVDAVVKDKRFKRIIGSYLGTMFMHGIDGTEVVYPTRAELVNFIHKNYNEFQHVTDFPEDYDQEEIERIVKDYYGNVKKELDELAKDIKFDEIKELNQAKKVLSIKTIFIVIGIALCVVLLIIFRHSFYKWLKWVSFPTVLSGTIFIIIGLLGSNIILSRFKFGEYETIIVPIIKSFAQNILIYGVISFALGIILSIIHYIIKKNVPKKINLDETHSEQNETVETKEETSESETKEVE